jgi:ferredoxin
MFKVNKEKCQGCGACVQACPAGAIIIGEDKKAEIDQEKCQQCGTCQKTCPAGAIEESNNQ